MYKFGIFCYNMSEKEKIEKGKQRMKIARSLDTVYTHIHNTFYKTKKTFNGSNKINKLK